MRVALALFVASMFALAAGIGLGAALARSQGASRAELHEGVFRTCIATLRRQLPAANSTGLSRVPHLTEHQIPEARRKMFEILLAENDCMVSSSVGSLTREELLRASGYPFTPGAALVPW